MDALSGATWFSTLDFSDGYWQKWHRRTVKRPPSPPAKACISSSPCPWASQCTCDLPEGHGADIKGAAMARLDDILIYSRSIEGHLSDLREVFTRIGEAGLHLNARKCHLAFYHIVFLGHVISAVGPDPQNTDKVKTWPVPMSATKAHAFLGLCSYYRRFVRSLLSVPPPQLLGKDIPFQWTADCQEQFEFLREALCAEPIMSHPDFTQCFTLYTDA